MGEMLVDLALANKVAAGFVCGALFVLVSTVYICLGTLEELEPTLAARISAKQAKAAK